MTTFYTALPACFLQHGAFLPPDSRATARAAACSPSAAAATTTIRMVRTRPTNMQTRVGVPMDDDNSSSGLSSPPSDLDNYSDGGRGVREEEDEEEGESGPIVSRFFQSPSLKKILRARKVLGEVIAAVEKEPTPELGDIVPALIKKEKEKEKKKKIGQRKPRGKKVKDEQDVKVEAPENWEEMYEKLREMRKKVKAPVDTMGCERLGDKAATPKLRRFHTLISLMLSSQTKDTINAVAMKDLQEKLPGGLCLESILEVEPKRLDELIRIVGFHNRKTEYIKKAAVIIRDKHGGDIPDTFEGLTALPGVGPKMAHLCLSAAWDRTEGIGVDVHVHRICNLWGWVKTTTPEGTREALQAWLPRDKWREINFLLVGFGQTICLPRGRKCEECTLSDRLCRAAFTEPRKLGVKREKRVISEDSDEDFDDDNYAAPKRPVRPKRRRVKVEVKEEVEEAEDEDALVDIEDAVPNLAKFRYKR
ncbi:DNA glycosylase [Choiromyces venosus 120613-1]|uniref:Endonuclease III homolog n=1 Tax=Choiromyces venosus 120613-1 TaxID=1336337 RepID=A0A3N4IUD7_9PEZI|nr:DNA glycosylase [Choiromyces venosus 120613-1]